MDFKSSRKKLGNKPYNTILSSTVKAKTGSLLYRHFYIIKKSSQHDRIDIDKIHPVDTTY